jgi:hypothetical protein
MGFLGLKYHKGIHWFGHPEGLASAIVRLEKSNELCIFRVRIEHAAACASARALRYRSDQSGQRDLINGTIEPQTAAALQAKFKRHGRSGFRLGRRHFRNLEIDGQKNCAYARRPQTFLLQLMTPPVNLLTGHITPTRHLRHS